MSIEQIRKLLELRFSLLETSMVDADKVQSEILQALRTNFLNYPVDFILETLTEFGQAPNLVYDDNGLFAVSAAGYQPVVTEDEKIEGVLTVFVRKEQWHETIREALRHYLFTE